MGSFRLSRRLMVAAPAAAILVTEVRAAGVLAEVRIGIVNNGSARQGAVRDRFERVLSGAALAAGRQPIFEFRSAGFDGARLDKIVTELLALPCEVFLCEDTFSAAAVLAKTTTRPVLFRSHAPPVTEGLVTSMARPGANASGVVTYSSSDRKLPELLIDAWAGARRIAFLYDPQFQSGAADETTLFARRYRTDLVRVGLRGPNELPRALSAIVQSGADAAIVPVSAGAWMRRRDLITWLNQRRIPAIFGRTEFAEAGGWASYGPVTSRADEQLAEYLRRVLMGARIGDLPVLRPDRHELVINLGTARAISRWPTRDFLRRADRLLG